MHLFNNNRSQPYALLFLILLSLFNFKAVAEPWNWPEQTSDAHLDHALQPGPTAAPMDHLELFKRQNAPGSSVCGYISGALCQYKLFWKDILMIYSPSGHLCVRILRLSISSECGCML